jgi:CDP-diacylglycerol---serine O-phosphatidyltransferase
LHEPGRGVPRGRREGAGEPRGRLPFWRLKKRRVRYVAMLPTLLTLGNGVCGFLAIAAIGRGLFDKNDDFFWQAGLLILIAMVFDALDGKVARMTRTASNFGAQMDSLCDLVTFGVAPAFLVYAINIQEGQRLPERVVVVVSVFYAMCALLRLARFTVETSTDEDSHMSFSGLPSPAAAGVIASAAVAWPNLQGWPFLKLMTAGALPFAAFVLGVLMVSRIRYAHVVNQLFRGFRPFVRLIELAMVALLIVIFHEIAIFLAFAGYVVTGPALWVKSRFWGRRAAPHATPTDQAPDDRSAF